MSKRWIGREAALVTVLSLAAGLGACATEGASQAYTGPGWYLEKSYLIVLGGPKVFGGPYSYDKCEEERIRLAPEVAADMLCVNHAGKPKKYGLY